MRLEYVSDDPDEPTLERLFEADIERYGHVSLFSRALAANPDILEARQTYLEGLRGSDALDDRTIELIYVAVAKENKCSYCFESHASQLVERFGIEPDAERTLDETDLFDSRERRIVSLARDIAADPRRGGSSLETLRDEGFSDGELIAILAWISAAISATTIADALAIHPDD